MLAGCASAPVPMAEIDAPPHVGFLLEHHESLHPSLAVVAVEEGAAWADLYVEHDCAAWKDGAPLANHAPVATASDPIVENDAIWVDGPGTMTLSAGATGTAYGTWRF